VASQPTLDFTPNPGVNMLKKGDLIELSDGTKAILTSDIYTHRYIDSEDEEMIAHGMGHLAGTYASAFNVLVPSTGRERRIRFDQTFTKIAESEIADDAVLEGSV